MYCQIYPLMGYINPLVPFLDSIIQLRVIVSSVIRINNSLQAVPDVVEDGSIAGAYLVSCEYDRTMRCNVLVGEWFKEEESFELREGV